MAKYFGSTSAEFKKVWPKDLAEVAVDGRTTWLPAMAVDELKGAEPVRGVRLLPPMDALIQARDRDLLVPDKAQHKEVWRVLGNPGVLLLDGEIAGVWRAKMTGKKRVDLKVTPFGPLSVPARKAVAGEAATIARAREVPDATVTYT